ncbi:MAG: IS4 family transposase, partial [Cyanobacteria bacterium P01_H01_bin.15]
QPLKLKSHGRRAKSLFRSGFDHLRSIFLNLEHKTSEFKTVLSFLSCT